MLESASTLSLRTRSRPKGALSLKDCASAPTAHRDAILVLAETDTTSAHKYVSDPSERELPESNSFLHNVSSGVVNRCKVA